ncbi:MAG: hypothetical protein VX681_13180 [Myxococcota bacterium]|nr:hypothetical protein [Myxococcota bacterium]
MKTRPLYFEIFCISLAAMLMEIAYTRIFSFKLYYYFTYLIIGVGLLGLGAGGVGVAVSRRLREADPARLLPVLCLAAGTLVLGGYLVIASAPINASRLTLDLWEPAKLAGVCLCLAAPFIAVGIAIATILGARPSNASRLYGADLLGAGLGCVMSIPLIVWLDPPRCVMLAGLLMLAAGVRLALPRRGLLAATALAAAALVVPLVAPGLLPDPVADSGKHIGGLRAQGAIIFTRWSPVFRVDVADFGSQRLLLHDGNIGSIIRSTGSGVSSHDDLATDSRALPFSVLDEGPRVLIIGSAGGHEILASLYFGASSVTAVELNPVTVHLLTERYADFAGRLHEDPRVRVVNAEGRSFLQGDDSQYDLIWFVAPDSYAAMNASSAAAFVLSESYLYTVEMLRESLQHLAPGGVICAQFGEPDFLGKPNRTLRYLATARQAFAEAGLQDFAHRVLVGTALGLPPFTETTILLSPLPVSVDQIRGFASQTAKISRGLAHYMPDVAANSAVGELITLPDPDLAEWVDEYPYLIDPVRDDSPFFWHFARFGDAISSPRGLRGSLVNYEDSIGEQILLVLLGIAALLAAIFLLLPLAAIRGIWREIPYKREAVVYFAALGLGFMFLEVSLIQMLTLLLGYPTYSLSVTLFGLLVFSGIGSILSARYDIAVARALTGLVAALAVLVSAYLLGLPIAVEWAGGAPLPLRIGLALLFVSPLGLCLGAFMPIGLRTLASQTEHQREYVAWAWSVNGFFSVIGSILSTLLAMTLGFSWLIALTVAIYALGSLALARVPATLDRG